MRAGRSLAISHLKAWRSKHSETATDGERPDTRPRTSNRSQRRRSSTNCRCRLRYQRFPFSWRETPLVATPRPPMASPPSMHCLVWSQRVWEDQRNPHFPLRHAALLVHEEKTRVQRVGLEQRKPLLENKGNRCENCYKQQGIRNTATTAGFLQLHLSTKSVQLLSN